MVRLENKHGVAVYVTPGEVRTISPHKDDGITVLHTGDSFFNVRGTPDEVHAKLFPASASPIHVKLSEYQESRAKELQEATMRVLTWCCDGKEDLPSYVVDDARKALGREAP